MPEVEPGRTNASRCGGEPRTNVVARRAPFASAEVRNGECRGGRAGPQRARKRGGLTTSDCLVAESTGSDRSTRKLVVKWWRSNEVCVCVCDITPCGQRARKAGLTSSSSPTKV